MKIATITFGIVLTAMSLASMAVSNRASSPVDLQAAAPAAPAAQPAAKANVHAADNA